MKNSYLISIVIPVYNTPKHYFKECLCSLVDQSYQNLEILIVDDGSEQTYADYYDKMVRQYQQSTRIIRIFHKKNAGVSAARNFGIEQSRGDYLLFVDSDDIAGKYYAETLLSLIVRYHSSMAACKFKRFTDSSGLAGKDEEPSGTLVDREKSGKGAVSNYLWDKIFDRRAFDELRFPDGVFMCEDFLIVYTILDRDPVCPVVTDRLYFYRITPSSLTENLNVRKCRQAIDVYETVLKFSVVTNDPALYDLRTVYCCRWRLRYMITLRQEKPENWKSILHETRKRFNEDMAPRRNQADTSLMKLSVFMLNMPEPISDVYLSIIAMARRMKIKQRHKEAGE